MKKTLHINRKPSNGADSNRPNPSNGLGNIYKASLSFLKAQDKWEPFLKNIYCQKKKKKDEKSQLNVYLKKSVRIKEASWSGRKSQRELLR